MNPHDPIERQLADALRRIRWVLNGLQLAGMEDWPRAVPSIPQPAAAGAPRNDDRQALLAAIEQELGDCKRCRLHEARNNLVFGEGLPQARVVFVGEGPGFDEDRQGRPFVGRAGKLLDKMIRAVGCRRREVFICNVVKCRPPGNRTPSNDEIETCAAFLFRQLEAIRPQVICALGACAAQTLLSTTNSISRLRGKPQSWHGIRVVATYHPAYLLRNPAQKAATWQDLLQVLRCLQENPADHRQP